MMIPRPATTAFVCAAFIAAAAINTARAQVPLPEEINEFQPSIASGCDSKESPPPILFCEMQKAFEKILTIRPGSTRGDLLKLFHMSGGLSTNQQGTYTYRDCYLIHVDVEFAAADLKTRSLSDAITRISRPYIAHPVAD